MPAREFSLQLIDGLILLTLEISCLVLNDFANIIRSEKKFMLKCLELGKFTGSKNVLLLYSYLLRKKICKRLEKGRLSLMHLITDSQSSVK